MDVTLAAPGLVAVVGGHSHSLLSNGEAGAVGRYPMGAPGGVAVVQAGAYARYLGRLDLDLGADGGVIAQGGGCRHVGEEMVPDPEVAGIVARFAAPLEGLRRKLVAVLDAALEVTGCRVGPCRLGGMVAEAMRGATHGQAIGLMNAGGLRWGCRRGR